MTMNKFGCVEMKRRGAAKVMQKTAQMTRAPELEFWQKRTHNLVNYSRVRSSQASGGVRIPERSHRAIGPIGFRTHLAELGSRTLEGSALATR